MNGNGIWKIMLHSLLLLLVLSAVDGSDEIETSPDGARTADAITLKSLKQQMRISGTPCTCSEQTKSCTCCGRIDELSTNFHQRGCASVHYEKKRNRTLRYDFTLNNQVVIRSEAAAVRNPTELCIPAAFLMICTKFFNVEFQNATFRFCFRLDVKYLKFSLLAIDFDCVRIHLAPGFNMKADLFRPGSDMNRGKTISMQEKTIFSIT